MTALHCPECPRGVHAGAGVPVGFGSTLERRGDKWEAVYACIPGFSPEKKHGEMQLFVKQRRIFTACMSAEFPR